MKIIVIVKEIFNTENRVTLDRNNQIDEQGMEYAVNIYDEYALEEAIRLREEYGGEVVIYSVCREEALDTYRYIMAMGIDRAVLIKSSLTDSMSISNMLADAIEERDNDYDLILGGWAGIDRNKGQVPGRLSQILNLPLINIVTKIDVQEKTLLCEREGETTKEIVETIFPALVTVQRGINIPRRPTAHNLMEPITSKISFIHSSQKRMDGNLKFSYELPQERGDAYMVEENNPDLAVDMLIKKLMDDKVL